MLPLLTQKQQKNKYIKAVIDTIEEGDYGPSSDKANYFLHFYKTVSQDLGNIDYVTTREKTDLYNYLVAVIPGISELMISHQIPDPNL